MTDPDARLARKSNGQASILAYAGHALMENRNGLVPQVCLTHATGTAEREAALTLAGRLGATQRITLGTDKGYDAQALIIELSIVANRRVSKTGAVRHSAIVGRTTRPSSLDLRVRLVAAVSGGRALLKSRRGNSGVTLGVRQCLDRHGWRFRKNLLYSEYSGPLLSAGR